jgi:hypothetical protein
MKLGNTVVEWSLLNNFEKSSSMERDFYPSFLQTNENITLKGLSHEIDLKTFNKNLQILSGVNTEILLTVFHGAK